MSRTCHPRSAIMLNRCLFKWALIRGKWYILNFLQNSFYCIFCTSNHPAWVSLIFVVLFLYVFFALDQRNLLLFDNLNISNS